MLPSLLNDLNSLSATFTSLSSLQNDLGVNLGSIKDLENSDTIFKILDALKSHQTEIITGYKA